MRSSIDINVDVGEGFDNEAFFLPYISSVNIACGGHFGTKESISRIIELCLENNVKIGAHPSYPDQENFGRVVLDISLEKLRKSIRSQIKLFNEVCAEHEVEPAHLKPHGALYHMCFHDKEIASMILDVCENEMGKIQIVCAPGSVLLDLGTERGFETVSEGFADRAYDTEGRLLSRKVNGSSLVDIQKIKIQVEELILRGQVPTIDHKMISLQVDTICFHGDSPNAIQHIQGVYEYLNQIGVTVL